MVADARSFVTRLAAQSRPIDKSQLQRILSIPVTRGFPTLSRRDDDLNLDETAPDPGSTTPHPDVNTDAEAEPISTAPEKPLVPTPPDSVDACVLSIRGTPAGWRLGGVFAGRRLRLNPRTDLTATRSGSNWVIYGALIRVLKSVGVNTSERIAVLVADALIREHREWLLRANAARGLRSIAPLWGTPEYREKLALWICGAVGKDGDWLRDADHKHGLLVVE